MLRTDCKKGLSCPEWTMGSPFPHHCWLQSFTLHGCPLLFYPGMTGNCPYKCIPIIPLPFSFYGGGKISLAGLCVILHSECSFLYKELKYHIGHSKAIKIPLRKGLSPFCFLCPQYSNYTWKTSLVWFDLDWFLYFLTWDNIMSLNCSFRCIFCLCLKRLIWAC